jgi:hypothetical protein
MSIKYTLIYIYKKSKKMDYSNESIDRKKKIEDLKIA